MAKGLHVVILGERVSAYDTQRVMQTFWFHL